MKRGLGFMGGQEQRIKELVLSKVAKCGQCGGIYDIPDINILGHKDDLWFLMLVCSSCHQAVGVAAVVREHGKRQAAEEAEEPVAQLPAGSAEADPSTEISERVPATAEPTPATLVSAQDVSSLHDFLQSFDGDFKRLFGERV